MLHEKVGRFADVLLGWTSFGIIKMVWECVCVLKRWKKPFDGWWKINTNVALSVADNAMGTGLVCRDHIGCVSTMMVAYFNPLRSSLCSSELMSILLACRWVEEQGFS